MYHILLLIIYILHILLIIFVLIIPFTNNYHLIFLHSIITPFIIIHWILNTHECILTVIEHSIRRAAYGKHISVNDCFTSRLIQPVFNLTNNHVEFSRNIYILTISLWLVSIIRLYKGFKTGKIPSFTYLLSKFK